MPPGELTGSPSPSDDGELGAAGAAHGLPNECGGTGEIVGTGEFEEDIEPLCNPRSFPAEAPDLYTAQVWFHYAYGAITRILPRAREKFLEPRPEPVPYVSRSEFEEDVEPAPGFPDLCFEYGLNCLGSHLDEDGTEDGASQPVERDAS